MNDSQKKWSWMMDYCKTKTIPPAQSWAWNEAKGEYDKNMYKLDGCCH